VPYESRLVPTHLGETFVIVWGAETAPPLVLLHGSAANATSWGIDAAAYAKEFRVYAVDLPGEAGRSTPARPPYGGPSYPDWLAEVFEGLGLAEAAIVGLSLGGWVGIRFAAAHPGRVTRLALIAPGGLAPAGRGFVLKALLYAPFGMWGIRRITQVVFSPVPPPPGAAEQFANTLRTYRPRRDNLPLVTDKELLALRCPVLFLGGDRDALLDTDAGASRLQRLRPNAEVNVIPGAGHALLGTADRCLPFLRRPFEARSGELANGEPVSRAEP
jgi:pimeloyl-ACP methyl ester carboxylesterase